jgi:outer membrane protein OmpA-like peptidoglycan-associated protein
VRLRLALSLAAATALAGCATPRVSLYPDADGKTGSVAVMRPDTGAEVGALSQPNTWTKVGGKTVVARPVKRAHTELMSQMPPPPEVFVLYFVEGGTDLTPASRPRLEELRKAVDANSWVQITGHTDTVGSTEDNDRLSRERAMEIRDVLVAQGLPVKNAKATGRGERELEVDTADGVDHPDNRRVEVILR